MVSSIGMERALTPTHSPTATPIIQLRGVRKAFGRHVVLDGIDLDIACNEAVAILGPSGSGKSTILRIISGLLPPDEGSVLIDGRPLEGIAGDDRVHVGMVFQNSALFDSLTVAENVGFVLFEQSRLSRKEILNLVARSLAMVGLSNVGDRYPSQLSGGMRKRVSLARAIIEDPSLAASRKRILLYDEPTAGLDPVASTIVEDLIRSLKDRQQACDSYIVVTHQDSTIRRAADRAILLYGGKVRWQGAVADIDRADNPFVRQFFSGSIEGPMQLLAKEV